MKYAILFILAMLTISSLDHSAHAQKAELILDFKSKNLSGVEEIEKLKQRDIFRIKVKNINLNLYKVAVNRTDSILVEPKVESNLFAQFDIESLAALAGSLTPIGGCS